MNAQSKHQQADYDPQVEAAIQKIRSLSSRVDAVARGRTAPRKAETSRSTPSRTFRTVEPSEEARKRGYARRGNHPIDGETEKGIQEGQLAKGNVDPRLNLAGSQKSRVNLGRLSTDHSTSPDDLVGTARHYSDKTHFHEKTESYHSKTWPGHHGIVYSGTEMLNTLVSTPGSAVQLLYNQQVNVMAMPATRLFLEAQNWQYYRIRKLFIQYFANLPATQAGQLAMGYVTDPDQNIWLAPTGGGSILRKMQSLDNTATFNIWQHHGLELTWGEDTPWLFVNQSDSARFQSAGSVFFALTSNPGLGTAAIPAAVGLIKMTYEVEFAEAIIDSSTSVFELTGITATPLATVANGDKLLVSVPLSVRNSFDRSQALCVVWSDGGSNTFDYSSRSDYTLGTPVGNFNIFAGTMLFAKFQAPTTLQFYRNYPALLEDDYIVQNSAGTAPAGIIRVVTAGIDFKN